MPNTIRYGKSLKFPITISYEINFNSTSDKYPTETVLQFNDLMQLLDVHEKLNVFLLMGAANKRIAAVISRYFENNPERFKRIVVCSRSPFVIYQVN